MKTPLDAEGIMTDHDDILRKRLTSKELKAVYTRADVEADIENFRQKTNLSLEEEQFKNSLLIALYLMNKFSTSQISLEDLIRLSLKHEQEINAHYGYALIWWNN
jgi:hypothetical protein